MAACTTVPALRLLVAAWLSSPHTVLPRLFAADYSRLPASCSAIRIRRVYSTTVPLDVGVDININRVQRVMDAMERGRDEYSGQS